MIMVAYYIKKKEGEDEEFVCILIWFYVHDNLVIERPIVSGGPAMDQVEQWMVFTKEKFGINPERLSDMTDMLEDMGFKNVSSKAVELPVGEWGLAPGNF